MSRKRYRSEQVERRLELLADWLIRRLLTLDSTLREGTVLTEGPPPYRRVDGGGRALVYVRCRPKKMMVRVDISGLWLDGGPCPLLIESAAGRALVLRRAADVEVAALHLMRVVEVTRSRINAARKVG